MRLKPLAQPPSTGNVMLDRWTFLLWKRLQETEVVAWENVGKEGSDLADLETRKHTDLQDLNTADYSHLTAVQVTDLIGGNSSSLHYHSSDRNLSNATGQLKLSNAAIIKAYSARHG